MVAEVKHNVVSVSLGNLAAPIVLVCEHASQFIPIEFDNLGLDQATRQSHIAWDPGAKDLTLLLSKAFEAPAVLGEVSRLVYDCNRPPSADDAVPDRSEVFTVPGNEMLSKLAFDRRVELYYRPFEKALSETLNHHQVKPILVTIHSFTPVYRGQKRDVEIGILHDEDPSVADVMLRVSKQHTDLNVMRNEPYGPDDGVTHTLRQHGIANGLPNVMIEVRNDLLQTHQQCVSMAGGLGLMLTDAINSSGLNQVQKVGVS